MIKISEVDDLTLGQAIKSKEVTVKEATEAYLMSI